MPSLLDTPIALGNPTAAMRPSIRVGKWTATGMLPPPVGRFLDLAQLEGPEVITTVAIRAEATMRRPGLPRIPLAIGMYHRIGREFAHDIAIGRGRLAVRLGADAYVDGRGCMRIGRSFQAGPELDQGALIAMWSEAIAFPSAWLGREDVRWEADGWTTATFVVPTPGGDVRIGVEFDPGTGCPAAFRAQRHKAGQGVVGWTGRTGDWRRFGGVLAPASFEAEWADEPGPWLSIRVVDLAVDVPVDRELDRARRLFPA